MERIRIMLKNIDDIDEFYNVSSKLECDVDVGRGFDIYDAKSRLGLLALHLDEALYVYIHSDDKDLLKLFNKWELT